MKTPAKILFTAFAGALTLLSASCASDRDYQARSTPSGHFYCAECNEYHPVQHRHYAYHYEDVDYRYNNPGPSKISVVVNPGRSTLLGPPAHLQAPD